MPGAHNGVHSAWLSAFTCQMCTLKQVQGLTTLRQLAETWLAHARGERPTTDAVCSPAWPACSSPPPPHTHTPPLAPAQVNALIAQGQVWRLATAPFVHHHWFHLAVRGVGATTGARHPAYSSCTVQLRFRGAQHNGIKATVVCFCAATLQPRSGPPLIPPGCARGGDEGAAKQAASCHRLGRPMATCVCWSAWCWCL